jgi:hypothetical protein
MIAGLPFRPTPFYGIFKCRTSMKTQKCPAAAGHFAFSRASAVLKPHAGRRIGLIGRLLDAVEHDTADDRNGERGNTGKYE